MTEQDVLGLYAQQVQELLLPQIWEHVGTALEQNTERLHDPYLREVAQLVRDPQCCFCDERLQHDVPGAGCAFAFGISDCYGTGLDKRLICYFYEHILKGKHITDLCFDKEFDSDVRERFEEYIAQL